MSFALSIIRLKNALVEPGCPICRVSDLSAERYIKQLLWESVNDGETRSRIIDSLGYCPEHTRLLALTEKNKFGDLLGTNIIYEHLSQVVGQRLRVAHQPPRIIAWFRRLAGKNSIPIADLTPRGHCRVCQLAEESAMHVLSTLMEELENGSEMMIERYSSSDGLCLPHLRISINQLSREYPSAGEFLRQDALIRLNKWQERMSEYIRKKAWEYRHEPFLPEEKSAWQETLAFFTGYPPDSFSNDSHNRDEKNGGSNG